MNSIKYPIGHYQPAEVIGSEQVVQWIDDIQQLPKLIFEAISGMSQNQLETPYREDGWSVRQVVHHIVDSHISGYCRIKWALTEDNPLIKTYDQDQWAQLPDYDGDLEYSLMILEGLHTRWVKLLRNLSADDLKRKFQHPKDGIHTVDYLIGLYAWHGKHHLAHIKSTVK